MSHPCRADWGDTTALSAIGPGTMRRLPRPTLLRVVASATARRPDPTRLDSTLSPWSAGFRTATSSDARRLTTVAGGDQRSRHFTVLLPRDRLDAVDIATDRPGSVHRFRVADLEPELTTSTALQVAAFVEAQAAELAAERLG